MKSDVFLNICLVLTLAQWTFSIQRLIFHFFYIMNGKVWWIFFYLLSLTLNFFTGLICFFVFFCVYDIWNSNHAFCFKAYFLFLRSIFPPQFIIGAQRGKRGENIVCFVLTQMFIVIFLWHRLQITSVHSTFETFLPKFFSSVFDERS